MVQPTDITNISENLQSIKESSEANFFEEFDKLDDKAKGKVVLELPRIYQKDICIKENAKRLAKIVNEMRADDATDFTLLLREVDELKWRKTIERMDIEHTNAVKALMNYDEDESGSIMEFEVFAVTKREKIQGSLKRLRKEIDKKTIENVTSIYLVDSQFRLLEVFPLDKVVATDPELTYGDIYDSSKRAITVLSHSSINEAVRLIERYDLNVLPVVNKNGRLLGRITHDDALDVIQESATKQIYSLNKVDPDEEIQESATESGKDRAIWLFINLINATLISIVIGIFEHSLQKVVALAVLMPIVANMAGTASMQTLTVIIRQMAIGNINLKNAMPTLSKEIKISILNGIVFSILATIISYVWFESILIGLVMAASMFISFISAGFFGAFVPIFLKRVDIDPAIASSVIVITVVDVIGFFSFLWFGTMWIPEISG